MAERRTPEEIARVCSGCRRELPIERFYFDPCYQRRKRKCRECCGKVARAWRESPNGQRALAGQHARRMQDPEYARAQKERAKKRKYTAEQIREKAAQAKERWPEKAAARAAVSSAVRSGRLVRPELCERCGGPGETPRNGGPAIQAHHDDYSRELDVMWLCTACHAERHREIERPYFQRSAAA